MTHARRSDPRPAARVPVAVPVLALAALLWAYWNTLRDLSREWWNDPDSSIGALVPGVVVFLVWRARRSIFSGEMRPATWLIAGVIGAQLIRGYGLAYLYESLERYAFLLSLVCAFGAIFGLTVLWRIRWPVLILFLMVPLPGAARNLISQPLQSASTSCTVWFLEAVGPRLTQEGNVLVLDDGARVGIAEACNGLRMLISFVVVAAVFAAIVKRPRWKRVTLVLSSIPIAFLCNTIRLSATVALFWLAESKVAEVFVHDFAGILMMPLAVAALAAELWLLDRLIEEPATPARPAGGADAAAEGTARTRGARRSAVIGR